MSGMTGCPLYVVHMTCEPSIAALRRGRALGYPVMGETCVQYFFLTVDDHMALPGFEGAKYVCSPPIRSTHDQGILWQAVRDGTLQAVSTDHCDFWYDGGRGPWQQWEEKTGGTNWAGYEKQDPSYRRPGKELGIGNFAKIPNGMPGLEDRMMVMWQAGVNGGKLSPSRFVELHCSNPAKNLRHVSPQGHNRCRLGCRYSRLGSATGTYHQRHLPITCASTTTATKAMTVKGGCRFKSTNVAINWSTATNGWAATAPVNSSRASPTRRYCKMATNHFGVAPG